MSRGTDWGKAKDIIVKIVRFVGLGTLAGWLAFLAWLGLDARWWKGVLMNECLKTAILYEIYIAVPLVSAAILYHWIVQWWKRRLFHKKWPGGFLWHGARWLLPETPNDPRREGSVIGDGPRCAVCNALLTTKLVSEATRRTAYFCQACNKFPRDDLEHNDLVRLARETYAQEYDEVVGRKYA